VQFGFGADILDMTGPLVRGCRPSGPDGPQVAGMFGIKRKTGLGCRSLLDALGVAAGLGFLLHPLSAAAQLVTQPTGVEVDTARIFGDNAPRATGAQVNAADGFSISAAITTEYSDNMVRLNDAVPLPSQYESRSDWRFQPNVSIAAGRPIGRQKVFANMLVGRDIYARNTILNTNRFLLDAGLDWSAGARCGGRLQGGYEDRGTRLDQFAVVVPSKQETVNFFASASCPSPVGISPNISYTWTKTNNSVTTDDPVLEDLRQLSDSRGQSINGGLTYRLAGRGDIGVQGSWSSYTFPNQVFNGQESGTEIIGLNGVANYRFGPSLQATLGLGYSWVDSKLEQGSDYSGLTYQGALVYSGPRLGANLRLSRGVTGSTGGLANYQIGTEFLFGVSYQAGDQLSLNAGFARSDIDVRGLDDLPINLIQQDYVLDRLFVGGDYSFGRRFSARIDYSHENRKSVPEFYSYKANVIAFSLRARF